LTHGITAIQVLERAGKEEEEAMLLAVEKETEKQADEWKGDLSQRMARKAKIARQSFQRRKVAMVASHFSLPLAHKAALLWRSSKQAMQKRWRRSRHLLPLPQRVR